MLPIRALFGATRKFTTSALLRSGGHGGTIGSNVPFDISNKYKLTLYFILFFGSGFSLPFIVVRHHLTNGTVAFGTIRISLWDLQSNVDYEQPQTSIPI